jgi:hypothetical protein
MSLECFFEFRSYAIFKLAIDIFHLEFLLARTGLHKRNYVLLLTRA